MRDGSGGIRADERRPARPLLPRGAEAIRGWYKEVPAELSDAVEAANPPVALVNDSRIPDGDFEASETDDLVGWTVEFKDGAEGSYEIDTNVSQSGVRSLKLTKTNGKGYILLRAAAAKNFLILALDKCVFCVYT